MLSISCDLCFDKTRAAPVEHRGGSPVGVNGLYIGWGEN